MYYTRNSNSNVRKYYAYLIWRKESGDGEKFLTSEVSLKGLVKLLSDDKQERVRYQIRWLNTQTRLHTYTHTYSFALDLSYCLFSHTSSANDKMIRWIRIGVGWILRFWQISSYVSIYPHEKTNNRMLKGRTSSWPQLWVTVLIFYRFYRFLCACFCVHFPWLTKQNKTHIFTLGSCHFHLRHSQGLWPEVKTTHPSKGICQNEHETQLHKNTH